MSSRLLTLVVFTVIDHGGVEPSTAMVSPACARGSSSSLLSPADHSFAGAIPAPLPTVRVAIDTSAIGEGEAHEIEAVVRARTEKLLEEEGWFMDDAERLPTVLGRLPVVHALRGRHTGRPATRVAVSPMLGQQEGAVLRGDF